MIKEIPCGAGSPHSTDVRGGQFDCIYPATAIYCSAEGECSFSAGDYISEALKSRLYLCNVSVCHLLVSILGICIIIIIIM